jgi:hypothetical protein
LRLGILLKYMQHAPTNTSMLQCRRIQINRDGFVKEVVWSVYSQDTITVELLYKQLQMEGYLILYFNMYTQIRKQAVA